MENISLKELVVPMIKSIDSFNYLLKSHHRKTAVIAYQLGKQLQLDNEHMTLLVVAAAMHDVGALSVVERDSLIVADVDNPLPHCLMGYKMLNQFSVFSEIARIIRHHHIHYEDVSKQRFVPFESFIIHLADRIDIFLNADEFVLDQKKRVTEEILLRCGTVFHPQVCEAFQVVAQRDIFWINIMNMTMEQLFDSIDFSLRYELDMSTIAKFSETISRIIDFRSQFTASHSATVAQLAKEIGSYFGLGEEDCFKLMIAGYLHDIGKIGIDPSIIEKNGPLTEQEYNRMKLHSYYTVQILTELGKTPWFAQIVTWAGHHHERIDGSGYPFAISGAELDLGTKILAYSDVLTALLEDRPYRPKMSLEKAMDIMKNQVAIKIDCSMMKRIEEHQEDIARIVNECQRTVRAHYVEEVNL